MHILHYILGLYFYTAIGPTATLHLQAGKLVSVLHIGAVCKYTVNPGKGMPGRDN